MTGESTKDITIECHSFLWWNSISRQRKGLLMTSCRIWDTSYFRSMWSSCHESNLRSKRNDNGKSNIIIWVTPTTKKAIHFPSGQSYYRLLMRTGCTYWQDSNSCSEHSFCNSATYHSSIFILKDTQLLKVAFPIYWEQEINTIISLVTLHYIASMPNIIFSLHFYK